MADLRKSIQKLIPFKFLGRRLRGAGREGAVLPDADPLAVEAPACQNCRAPLQGTFCAICGQKDTDLNRSSFALMWSLADDVVSPESRLLRTTAMLFFLPGLLTKSYMEGKRARFIPPIRLYLIASLLFFLALSLSNVAIVRILVTPVDERAVSERIFDSVMGLSSLALLDRANPEDTPGLIAQRERVRKLMRLLEERLMGDEEPLEGEAGSPDPLELSTTTAAPVDKLDGDDDVGILTIDGKPYRLDIKMFSVLDNEAGEADVPENFLEDFLEEASAEMEKAEGDSEKFVVKVIQGFRRAALEPQKVNDLFNKWLPRGMIILLPFFALLMRFFYWGRNGRLVKQLIFSLHFHTYIFVVLTLLMLAQVFLGAMISGWIFIAAVPLYLFVAMKVIFGQGWFRTILKYAFVAVIYAVVLTVSVATITMLGLADL